MAGVKFSAFTTGATTANTLIVGYDSVAGTNNQYTLAQLGAGLASHIDNIYTADGSIATGVNRTLTLAGTGTLKVAGAGAAGDFMIKNAGNDADAYTVYMTDGTGQANIGAYGGINFISRYGSVGSTASYNNLGTWSFERNVVVKGQGYTEQHDSLAGNATVDWDDGNVQYIQLASGANTFTPSNPQDGATYILQIKQPSSGAAGTITWGASVKWPAATAPTLTATNDYIDVVTLIYNGTTTHYYAAATLDLR
jgi:hypothetical protein